MKMTDAQFDYMWRVVASARLGERLEFSPWTEGSERIEIFYPIQFDLYAFGRSQTGLACARRSWIYKCETKYSLDGYRLTQMGYEAYLAEAERRSENA